MIESRLSPSIIAAAPVLNEEGVIGTLVLKTRPYVNEIIVVDDGSRDRTAEIAALSGATVVTHSTTQGYGVSMQRILAEARRRQPDALVILGTDPNYDPAEIPRVAKELGDGHDIVVCDQEVRESNAPLFRRLERAVFRSTVRILFGNIVLYPVRGFSKNAINTLEIRENGTAVSVEIITEAAKKRLKIVKLPLHSAGATLPPLASELGDNLTNILVVHSQGRLLAIPAAQMQMHQVVTPADSQLLVMPYVTISRLGLFWRKCLDDFERLLNDPGAKEQDFQSFFEKNPLLLQGSEYQRVVPHPILEREPEFGNLVPDFLLQPLTAKYGDIVDLKLPTEKIITGTKNRMRFSSAVQEAVPQVREYRDYFEDPIRRQAVMDKYGMSAYRPGVAVVIGRQNHDLAPEKLRQITDALPGYVKVIAYDELYAKMKRMAYIYGIQ